MTCTCPVPSNTAHTTCTSTSVWMTTEEILRTAPNHIDLWHTRTSSSGAFDKAKRSGDVLKGARKADRS